MVVFMSVRKKSVERIAGILAGLVIFTAITHMLDDMYVDVDGMAWYRIMWHHFYEDKGKIDNICLGSSHVFCAIDPSILDQINGQYNFNVSTPIQQINSSYYLLREADRMNKLSHVYLEMYYQCTLDDRVLSDNKRNWYNLDYMKPSLNKAEYMLNIGRADQYVNILLPFSRYRVRLGDWTYVKDELGKKGQENYDDYRFVIDHDDGNGRTVYEKQGFYKSTRVYRDREKIYPQRRILSGCSIVEKNENYCRRIIEYCKNKEIPITLFISPINDLELISTLDYDDYSTEIRELASEYGIPFYDFNLAREKYLPFQYGKYFMDEGHLNQYGAELFTSFFYQVITGEETDNKRYFYNSYTEKLKELPPTVYGVYFKEPGGEEERKTMWIASNRDFGLKYRIILTPEEGEQYMVQDFCENKEFQVPLEESGICTIVARTMDEPEKVQTMEINY